MLTAKVCVRYEGNWTAELTEHDVSAQFPASTFRNREYIGLMTLETSEFETVLQIIEDAPTVLEVDVVERYDRQDGTTAATLFLEGVLTEFTPAQTLLYEGFLPMGPTTLENGRECFDLLLRNRDELTAAVEALEEFGHVSVERISQEFSREVTPSSAEWQELLASIPARQRELLNLAVREGYFEIPRETTLEEIAEELGITKTTASNHLRKVERQMMEFFVPYLNLSGVDT